MLLHSQANGFGWCRCVAWWVPTLEGFGERTTGENLMERREVFAAGEHDGLLAYRCEEPVGWCQVGRRDRLPGVRSMFGLPPDPDVWSVTCLAVAPSLRGRGIARQMLHAAIDRAATHGASAIEGYPRRDEPGEPVEEWTGPMGLFIDAGFEVVDDRNRRRLVVRRAL